MPILYQLRRHSKEIVFYTVLAIVVCFILFPEQSFELLNTIRSAFASMLKSEEEETETPPTVEETVNA